MRFNTLQNNSFVNQQLLILLCASEIYALNFNEEMVSLTIIFLKGSECFVEPFFDQQPRSVCTFFIYLFIYLLHLFIYLFLIIHLLLNLIVQGLL